ncbi:ATP-dependent DNA helicase [Actinomadura sp. HBU206391]|uniref:ATP-dependent DNA helicase n=1 Tax=Actinomadura sp. HBU206391 TaxID=2731692 RepID=UPI00164FD200|nr:helicase C-terminal domain-containing protein [Actinomadura sp. HBU206391]MBC6461987.1 ATP-dependent helicase [Actinomadura sp. HBU206391]
MPAPAASAAPRLTDSDAEIPDIATLLATAVQAIGGAERPGQVTMAEAVEHAIESGDHLAAQAGTGTGKSLAYLVPAIRHAVAADTTVVVSTATIALQQQLVDRDLPRLAEALEPLLGKKLNFAILKGRRNYLCLHRVQTGAPEDPEEGLFDPQALSGLGRQIKRLHDWADETRTGDRDELVPGVGEQAWRQVAVTAKECLGAQRCPHGTTCFAEMARAEAGDAHIVVTNHALLAIDALEEFHVLPEHDVVVIDEAHELVDKVTSVDTDDLSAAAVETAARRCGRLIEEGLADRLQEAAESLKLLLNEQQAGRMDMLPAPLGDTLAVLRDAAHACVTALGPEPKDGDPGDLAARRAARSSVEDVHDTAVRLLGAFEAELAKRWDVVWLDKHFEGRRPPTLRVAPIGVGGLLRASLFETRTAILTSATLTLGGSFEPLARQWGLPPLETPDTGAVAEASAVQPEPGPEPRPDPESGPGSVADSDSDSESGTESGPESAPHADAASPKAEDAEEDAGKDQKKGKELKWSGIDVGSPFDHPRAGILYVAKHLPQPGRDGLPEVYLSEIAELIAAAGGRTLGLFSSMRAARQAADELKDRLDHPLLCQGEDSTSLLVKRFAEDERTSLFGTLSLWQGVDVPGPSLQLVIVDRVPFPRPDDPLSSARQRAVAAHGGNGFMAVAATHAALLLAQGAGRLLRSMDDRGVVAILDPRLVTARYGGFLKSSLPPFWTTTDPAVVRAALRRIDAD